MYNNNNNNNDNNNNNNNNNNSNNNNNHGHPTTVFCKTLYLFGDADISQNILLLEDG